MTYTEFLESKLMFRQPTGIDAQVQNSALFDWQRAVVNWGLARGKSALFEDCGLGKTAQQLCWAQEIARETKRPVLILAPLAVSAQTKREGLKFGVDVTVCESRLDVKNGVNITNYEKLQHFDASVFGGVVLDESSILKAYMGKTKRQICDVFSDTPYRLACTATPAPNDLMELLNHAEFLGIMRSSEALSVWFIADQSNSGAYKLKGHAQQDFWRWVASWAVCMEKPSDIGYNDDGYVLPPLTERDVIVPVSDMSDDCTGGFLRTIDMSATGFNKERHRTTAARADACASLVDDGAQHIIWCGTNEEEDALRARIGDAVAVRGSDKPRHKEETALAFINGSVRVLISKPSIFGYGLNFQNCASSVFCGLDYSYENYYQAVRRLYRFGQKKAVDVVRVLGSTEKSILDVINKKQSQKADMAASMAVHMRDLQTQNLGGHGFKLCLEKQCVRVPNWLRSETA